MAGSVGCLFGSHFSAVFFLSVAPLRPRRGKSRSRATTHMPEDDHREVTIRIKHTPFSRRTGECRSVKTENCNTHSVEVPKGNHGGSGSTSASPGIAGSAEPTCNRRLIFQNRLKTPQIQGYRENSKQWVEVVSAQAPRFLGEFSTA